MSRSRYGLLFLLAVLCMLFAPYWLAGRIPLNADFIDSHFEPWASHWSGPRGNPELDDTGLLWYPIRKIGMDQVRQGRLPLWNPSILCGTPLFEDQYCQPLCPWNLFFLLLPPLDAWTWLLAASSLTALLGMFWFLRRLGRSTAASCLGAVAFTLCTYFATFVEWPQVIGTYAWLPFACLAVEALRDDRRWRWVGLGAWAIGLQFWCGSIQMSCYFLVLVLLLMAWRCRRDRALATRYGVMLLLGGLMGAAMILPGVQILHATAREPLRYTAWLRPQALLTYLWPDIFGNPVRGNYVPATGLYLMAMSGYIGLWSLMVAWPGRHFAEPERRPYAVAMLLVPIGILLTGIPAFVAAAIAVKPYLFSIDHYRATGIYTFAAATLAAWGLDDRRANCRASQRQALTWLGMLGAASVLIVLLEYWPGRNILVTVLHVLRQAYGSSLLSPNVMEPLLLGVAFAGWTVLVQPRSERAWAVGIVVVVTLDLLHGAMLWNRFAPRDEIYPTTPELTWLQHAPPGRMLVMEPPGSIRGRSGILPPNLPMMYGLSDVRGYLSLKIKRYFDLAGNLPKNYFFSLPDADWPLVDLLGVRYLVTTTPCSPSHWKLAFDGDLKVYENLHPCDRAFWVQNVSVLPHDALVERLHDVSFDPHQALLVEPDSGLATAAGGQATGSAAIQTSEPDRVVVNSQAEQSGYLVLSDTMYAGWTATVDGRSTPIVTAYSAFRAVPVPAGTHVVQFLYRPTCIYVGLALTALAALVALVLLRL